MEHKVTIRMMCETDAKAVSALMPTLGYEATPEIVLARFANIEQGSSDYVFVAEKSGDVIAFCHAKGIRRIDSDGYGEILTVVVDDSHHRLGIGRQIIEHASEWIFRNGFSRVRLGSGVHRIEAHLFYESLGFTKSRPGCVFELRKK